MIDITGKKVGDGVKEGADKGAILIAAPLKIVNGTGSPIRALALVPKG